jgi:uncharacterized membrane protein
MDTNQNNSRSDPERQKPAAPDATAEAGAKLKEAEAKLMEAEAKLMDPSSKPAANAGTTVQRTATDERQPRQLAPNAYAKQIGNDASPKGEHANPSASDPNKKDESAAARLESAANKASAEAKERTPSKPVTEHLSENVAGMLCYLFGWASGLVFLFIDRRPFVRFHAAQSVAIFATLNILILALSGFFLGALVPGIADALLVLRRALELVWLVATVVLILKVAGGERYRVKMASEYGDRAARGVK